MSETSLKSGDVVLLKSDSPQMVVERARQRLRNGNLGFNVLCTWFVNGQKYSA